MPETQIRRVKVLAARLGLTLQEVVGYDAVILNEARVPAATITIFTVIPSEREGAQSWPPASAAFALAGVMERLSASRGTPIAP